ncbi:MAG: excinuclease ABC subunit UvrC [Bacteroidia bacterium]|nr:excinuclease ABC subunit UvrC [Bacteroidia bacterium]
MYSKLGIKEFMEIQKEVIEKVRALPDQPGVYRFLNQDGKIIYIGKAKSLRKRVGSYFTNSRGHSYRISHMVRNIRDVAYTVTNSEVEALLLENNLIKNHQPRYNILLKDGKTYPYICIKNERFPRVFPTRTKIDDGSTYYGPYPSVATMKAILELIRSIIQLRTCNFYLSEKNIEAGKFKRCLEFQIGNCGAPCEGRVKEEEYMEGIAQVRHILRGNLQPVLKHVEGKMNEAAAQFEFEKADFYKRRLESVRAYKRRSTVVSEKINDLEVLAIESEEHLSVVNHFKVVNGAIIQTHSWEFKQKHEESESEILLATIEYMMAGDEELEQEIITNIEIEEDDVLEGYKLSVPQRGDKKHLVDLSLKNCRTLLTEKLYNQNFKKRKPVHESMMEELQKELNMSNLPDHIECFDNSNFQGSSPVASCVVFKNGKPSKRDYRHFNIKTVEGPNDFASMTEIVGRRYKRLLDEEKDLPKLIIIDGGKGQLSSAAEALQELGLLGKIPMIGIAKRLEEIYRVDDPIPLHIDKKSPALHLIQQLRNEAHRFAITFHRQKRSNTNQRSKLTQIKGIGPQAEKEIIKKFRSIKKLKEAPVAELEAKLGKKKAEILQKAIKDGLI